LIARRRVIRLRDFQGYALPALRNSASRFSRRVRISDHVRHFGRLCIDRALLAIGNSFAKRRHEKESQAKFPL
jgi:hypothetical protein